MMRKTKTHNIVYCTTHLATGKYYIGLHSTDDLDDGYRGSGKIIGSYLRKYPESAFSFKIIANFKERQDAADLEAILVQPFLLDRSTFPDVLNLNRGGDSGRDIHFTDDTRKIISEKVTKFYKDNPDALIARRKNQKVAQNKESVRLKRNASRQRALANTNLRERIVENTKSAWADPEKRARIIAGQRSPEVRAKLSIALRQPCPEITRQKLRDHYARLRELKQSAIGDASQL